MSAAIASAPTYGRRVTPTLVVTTTAAAGLFGVIVAGLASGGASATGATLKLGASDYSAPVDSPVAALAPVALPAALPAALPVAAAPVAPKAAAPMAMPSSSGCTGASGAAGAFLTHFYAGHLGESPGQQVADASNVDQYAKTHTVLVGNMLAPVVAGADSALGSFLTHFYAGHLGESPGQQVTDALNADQYTKTHTVLVGNMAAPLVGTPGC